MQHGNQHYVEQGRLTLEQQGVSERLAVIFRGVNNVENLPGNRAFRAMQAEQQQRVAAIVDLTAARQAEEASLQAGIDADRYAAEARRDVGDALTHPEQPDTFAHESTAAPVVATGNQTRDDAERAARIAAAQADIMAATTPEEPHTEEPVPSIATVTDLNAYRRSVAAPVAPYNPNAQLDPAALTVFRKAS